MKRMFRENGLSIVMLGLFFTAFLAGQTISGRLEYNDDQRIHGRPSVGFAQYVTTPHFLEATMENWESEFLQMFLFVALTAFLYQKGSAESKKLDEEEPVDRDPRLSKREKDVPYPVRKGGIVLKIYENSLSLAFLVLFVACFVLHAIGGAAEHNQEQLEHGIPEQLSPFQYLSTMVILSIWLRQRGSPESKPVDAPHSQTGKD
jgi:hypothetical protein